MDKTPHDPEVTEAAVALAPPPRRAQPGPGGPEAAARRLKAVTLAVGGFSFEHIAQECGWASEGVARKIVRDALRRAEAVAAADYRDLENARLDRATAAIWPKVINGDIKAGHLFLRISERRARMNGLDAPTQIMVAPATQAELGDALGELRRLVQGEVVAVDDDTG